jgi:hypothetical protein
VGLVIAGGAFFTGPSVTATRTRAVLSKLIGGHLPQTAFGAWVRRNRTMLRVAAVLLGVLVFVFWDRPTGLVVLTITGGVLVLLILIELW